jgi:hypothetical protein
MMLKNDFTKNLQMISAYTNSQTFNNFIPILSFTFNPENFLV